MLSEHPATPRYARDSMSRGDTPTLHEAGAVVTTAQRRSDWRIWLALAASLLALGGAILDFALIVGGVPVPVPGLRSPSQAAGVDTATYNFENDANGWATRGVAANALVGDAHVFAGQQALGFQVTNLSGTRKAFVYTARPAIAGRRTRIIARLYVPAGAPPLIATAYVLDKSWRWYNGSFPVLTPGQWTPVIYEVPAQAQRPIQELGLMILVGKGSAPYSGPLYLDSVDVQPR